MVLRRSYLFPPRVWLDAGPQPFTCSSYLTIAALYLVPAVSRSAIYPATGSSPAALPPPARCRFFVALICTLISARITHAAGGRLPGGLLCYRAPAARLLRYHTCLPCRTDCVSTLPPRRSFAPPVPCRIRPVRRLRRTQITVSGVTLVRSALLFMRDFTTVTFACDLFLAVLCSCVG